MIDLVVAHFTVGAAVMAYYLIKTTDYRCIGIVPALKKMNTLRVAACLFLFMVAWPIGAALHEKNIRKRKRQGKRL